MIRLLPQYVRPASARYEIEKLLGLLAFMVTILFATPHTAGAQSCTADALLSADANYALGKFSTSTSLLNNCLPNGFEVRADKILAWRLLALSHLAVDSLDRAREDVRGLLRVDARFKTNPETDPRSFVSLVSNMKPRWYTFPWKGRQWYHWAGRAAIVGAAVSIPILTKKDVLPDLPAGPIFPTQ